LPTLQAVQTALNKLDEEKVTVPELPQELPAFIKKFRTHPPPDSLQSKINDYRQSEARGKTLAQYQKEKTLICQWESRQTPFASAALKAYTLSSEFVLTDDETRFMVAHATANKPNEMASLCSCGTPLDLNHCTSCGPNVLYRHNRLQNRFVALAREQGCTTEQNPRESVHDAAKMLEPDIVFYFGLGYAIETDITVVNPTAPSYVARSSYPVRGSALNSTEQRKKNKYEERANMRGGNFLPLGFETHGLVGPGVLKLLQQLAKQTDPGIGLAVRDMMIDLQITLVRGNALCARTVAARARRAEDQRRGAQGRAR
jgi:hypothetical protein